MPWKESSVMDERLHFVARLLDGEQISLGCREIFERYKDHGLETLTDRSRRPVRYANQLPQQVESLILGLRRDKPQWGARKIRELRIRRLAGDVRVPAKSASLHNETGIRSEREQEKLSGKAVVFNVRSPNRCAVRPTLKSPQGEDEVLVVFAAAMLCANTTATWRAWRFVPS
jgi:Homeodomain-like domain